MTTKDASAAAGSGGEGSTAGEAKRDTLSEAIDKAVKTVTGSGATKDGVPAKKTSEAAGESAEEETTSEDAEEAGGEAGEGEGEDTDEAGEQSSDEEGDGEKPKPYTKAELSALRPGELFDLDMERVPEDYRDFVRGLKAAFTRESQAQARARADQPTGEGKPADKKLSRQDLFDKANEGPDGFAEALDTYIDQKLTERGLTPERAEAERNDAVVEEAIAFATETHTELGDANFKRAVGQAMVKNPKMAQRLANAIEARDSEKLAMVVEQACEQVKRDRHNQTEKARQAAKAKKETANATQVGSLAAESTTRGTSKAGGNGKAPTLDQALDDAIKTTGAKSYQRT